MEKFIKQLFFTIATMLVLFIPLSANGNNNSNDILAGADCFSVFGDFLYWHASQETASTWASAISDAEKVLEFDATNIDFKWNPGFRVGLGYTFDNCWDANLAWTYYKATTNSGFDVGDQIVLPEFFSGFLSQNFFFGADIHWRLLMNMIDLEFGQKINICEALCVHPKFGIKGGTINQNIRCEWDARIFTSIEELKHKYTAVGPSFGFDIKWDLCDQFSLYSDFSTAFMWGNWKVEDTYIRPLALDGLITPTTITTRLNRSKLGTLMVKYLLGLEWNLKPSYPISFFAGYEFQFWPNQLRIPTFQQLPLRGGLTLQGGSCRVRFDF